MSTSGSESEPSSSLLTAGRPSADMALSRSATAALGVVQPPAPVTRQELMQRGMSTQQADVALVQQAEQEVLAQHFVRFTACFACIGLLVCMTLFGLWVWLLVAYAKVDEESRGQECNAPLKLWATVVIAISCLKTGGKCLVDQLLCCWAPTAESPAPPLRIQLKDFGLLLFEFAWVIVMGPGGSAPPCQEIMPNLRMAAKVYVCFNAAATLFIWLGAIGLLRVLIFMLRRGLLTTSSGAPPEAIENITEEVELTAEELAETPSCPICLADFQGTATKMKACGHAFHKPCLRNWLTVARTCPICLAAGAASDTPGGATARCGGQGRPCPA